MITGDAMARPMIEALEEDPDRYDLSSLFVVSSSAAVFSPTVKDRFLELLPNVIIIDSIGSSEGGMNGMVAVQQGPDRDEGRRPHGEPRPRRRRARRRPRSRSSRARAWSAGSPGAATSRSATTRTRSRRRRPSSPPPTAGATWWPATSPPSRPTASITLLGRGSVCINSGGEKIFPEEVEAALKAHPEVYDVRRRRRARRALGLRRSRAVVQPRNADAPPSLDDLDAHCRTKIAGYKVPRQLDLVDEIVRSPAGKPDYPWATPPTRGRHQRRQSATGRPDEPRHARAQPRATPRRPASTTWRRPAGREEPYVL